MATSDEKKQHIIEELGLLKASSAEKDEQKRRIIKKEEIKA